MPGLPIFPLYAATFLPTFVFPFLDANERMRDYEPDALLRAALTAAGFILLGTFVSHYWVSRPHPPPSHCRALEGSKGTDALLIAIALAIAFNVMDHAGWLTRLPTGVFTILRSALRGPVSFAVFVLAMRWGKRLLQPLERAVFVALFAGYCITEAASLFLVGVILVFLMLVLGFVLGRQRLPPSLIAIGLVVPGLLHAGKGEMRSNYWKEGDQGNQLAPLQYPRFFSQWAKSSFQVITLQKRGLEKDSTSILSRANTVYLLLLAQSLTPGEVPFLGGETYSIIPSALVPRLFDPEKASPHYSTSLLNVLYGTQTWEAAASTSIGWGMLNEAYANFGYTGCAIAAVLIANFFGLVSWWCKGMPAGSIQNLIGIYTLGFALQTEMTAAIFITAYLQGLVGLLGLAWVFARRRPTLEFEQEEAENQKKESRKWKGDRRV
jgi:hypothetical protein